MQNQDHSQIVAPVSNPAILPTPSQPEAAGNTTKTRKPFVEPMISPPVDALEATRFFAQAVSSGIIT